MHNVKAYLPLWSATELPVRVDAVVMPNVIFLSIDVAH